MANAKEARIKMYMHCKTCMWIDRNKDGKPVKWGSKEHLAFGTTPEGYQLVCETCGKSIIDLDLLGQKITNYEKGRGYLKDKDFMEQIRKGGKYV